MSASMPRQECHLAPFQGAEHVRVRRLAERGLHRDLVDVSESGHGIQTAAAHNADFCLLQRESPSEWGILIITDRSARTRNLTASIVYHFFVIRRLYVHNFRCLENFELTLLGQSSVLLIGKNGAGKTTVGLALQILQNIAREKNRVGDLVKPKDLTQERTEVPMRFEVEVEIGSHIYEYVIAFELPEGFRELRVFEEKLLIDTKPVYTREAAQVHLTRSGQARETSFPIDWHLVALPIVQQQSTKDPLFIFKQWLARMLILRPLPSLIVGDSTNE